MFVSGVSCPIACTTSIVFTQSSSGYFNIGVYAYMAAKTTKESTIDLFHP